MRGCLGSPRSELVLPRSASPARLKRDSHGACSCPTRGAPENKNRAGHCLRPAHEFSYLPTTSAVCLPASPLPAWPTSSKQQFPSLWTSCCASLPPSNWCPTSGSPEHWWTARIAKAPSVQTSRRPPASRSESSFSWSLSPFVLGASCHPRSHDAPDSPLFRSPRQASNTRLFSLSMQSKS